MADISKITVGGVTYNIKDLKAREDIAALSSYTEYLGVTTTDLVDGVTTSPNVVIGEKTVIAKKGNIVTKGKKEFIYNGNTWQEFGDLSALRALAFEDSASGSYTPAGRINSTFTGTPATISVSGTATGTVSKPTFTGTQGSVSVKGTSTGSVDIKTATPTEGQTANYTPAGTVSKPTFTGTKATINVKGTPTGSVGVTAVAGTTSAPANYTPAGTVSKPTFTGTAKDFSITGTPTGSVDIKTKAPTTGETANYTPAGTVSKPSFSGVPSKFIASGDGVAVTIKS